VVRADGCGPADGDELFVQDSKVENVTREFLPEPPVVAAS
jgi:hypothetical protein